MLPFRRDCPSVIRLLKHSSAASSTAAVQQQQQEEEEEGAQKQTLTEAALHLEGSVIPEARVCSPCPGDCLHSFPPTDSALQRSQL